MSVFKGLEADGVLGPFVFTEEGGARSAGEDEVVEGIAAFFGGGDFGKGVDLGDGVEKDFDVFGFAEDGAQGAGNVGGCKGSGGDLVEKGLKEVVVLFVDESDLEARVVSKLLGAGKASESAADDENVFGTSHGRDFSEILGDGKGDLDAAGPAYALPFF